MVRIGYAKISQENILSGRFHLRGSELIVAGLIICDPGKMRAYHHHPDYQEVDIINHKRKLQSTLGNEREFH